MENEQAVCLQEKNVDLTQPPVTVFDPEGLDDRTVMIESHFVDSAFVGCFGRLDK